MKTQRKVFVYRNLNRKGIVFSVKCNRTGLVIDRRPVVIIKNPLFIVSKAGRERVLKNKVRNVHAGIKGDQILRLPPGIKKLKCFKFHYNPYKVKEFTTEEGNHIFEAKYVALSPAGLFAYV